MSGHAPITVPMVRDRKHGEKLTMVTAYDFPSASIASEAGIDIILVGDSLANVVHGFDDTLAATVDMMIMHAAAVRRADPHSLVVVDMPWMSYHIAIEDSIRNAGRLIREGHAQAVKIEGGSNRAETIRRIVDAEIPVMGHLGLTPQSVNTMGGYRVQGKDIDDAQRMIADAKALEQAGVFAIVLEGVPDVLAEAITRAVAVPTIGIGAGDATDGQVLVFHDVLGIGAGRYPKFVRSYADLRSEAIAALSQYRDDVVSGAFPGEDETYHVRDEVAEMLGVALSDTTQSSSLPS